MDSLLDASTIIGLRKQPISYKTRDNGSNNTLTPLPLSSRMIVRLSPHTNSCSPCLCLGPASRSQRLTRRFYGPKCWRISMGEDGWALFSGIFFGMSVDLVTPRTLDSIARRGAIWRQNFPDS